MTTERCGTHVCTPSRPMAFTMWQSPGPCALRGRWGWTGCGPACSGTGGQGPGVGYSRPEASSGLHDAQAGKRCRAGSGGLLQPSHKQQGAAAIKPPPAPPEQQHQPWMSDRQQLALRVPQLCLPGGLYVALAIGQDAAHQDPRCWEIQQRRRSSRSQLASAFRVQLPALARGNRCRVRGKVLCRRLEGPAAVGGVSVCVRSVCDGCKAAWHCCESCQSTGQHTGRSVAAFPAARLQVLTMMEIAASNRQSAQLQCEPLCAVMPCVSLHSTQP
jgi:hypothetical protein